MDLTKYLDQVRIPSPSSKIYKEECCVSFDSPTTEGGIFIDLNTFQAFGKEFVHLNLEKNGQAIYVNLKRTKKEQDEVVEPSAKKPTRLAIGTADGFNDDKESYEEAVSIVILPDFVELPYPDVQLPEKIRLAVDAVVAAEGAERSEAVAAWEAEEERKPSKFATEDYLQLDNGVKVPPSGWKCSQCDLTTNLWLNLTDGSIGCGRKFFDGTGGNNHAVEHSQATGYPLAVKLGTISADISKADVYSYDPSEDDMVLDPFLEKHLAHFGIDFSKMEKSDKSMAELELDANVALDLSRLTEHGKALEPLFGPGYTGMKNLGNSCYMASVMQAMLSTDVLRAKYFDGKTMEGVFRAAPSDPFVHLPTQLSKLAQRPAPARGTSRRGKSHAGILGVLSGRYSAPGAGGGEEAAVAPRAFKNLVGSGHPEFSSSRQQDALEYYQHFLQLLERAEHAAEGAGGDGTSKYFQFAVEEKLRCGQSGKVRYQSREENVLSLPIPLERASNAAAVAASKVAVEAAKASGGKVEAVRPVVSFQDCLDVFAAEEIMADYKSPATGGIGTAVTTNRLATFPDNLVVHMRRFTVEEGSWVPKKLDVNVEVPDTVDFSALRGAGLQDGEELLPDEAAAAPARPAADLAIVMQLESMGFERARCEAAAVETNNAGVEAAMELLIAKMDDPTFGAEPSAPAGGAGGGAAPPDEESVAMLMSMGFERPAVLKALNATDNNLERAADWIFSHAGELDSMDVDAPASAGGAPAAAADVKASMRDGSGVYKLVGFVSHMGTSTSCGHYVVHILKDGQWVLFNDEKVAKCEDVPKDLGYMYFFKRA